MVEYRYVNSKNKWHSEDHSGLLAVIVWGKAHHSAVFPKPCLTQTPGSHILTFSCFGDASVLPISEGAPLHCSCYLVQKFQLNPSQEIRILIRARREPSGPGASIRVSPFANRPFIALGELSLTDEHFGCQATVRMQQGPSV